MAPKRLAKKKITVTRRGEGSKAVAESLKSKDPNTTTRIAVLLESIHHPGTRKVTQKLSLLRRKKGDPTRYITERAKWRVLTYRQNEMENGMNKPGVFVVPTSKKFKWKKNLPVDGSLIKENLKSIVYVEREEEEEEESE